MSPLPEYFEYSPRIFFQNKNYVKPQKLFQIYGPRISRWPYFTVGAEIFWQP